MIARKAIILATITLFLTFAGCLHAGTLVNCSSSQSCDVSVYQSSNPTGFARHTIQIVPPTDSDGNTIQIPDTDQVTFIYDGAHFTTTCNGTQANMGSSAGIEIQDKISCTVDRSGDVAPGTTVYVTLVIHDQSVYNHPYSDCPGYTVDDQLRDTSESAPFCVNDDLNHAKACKWEEQNLNDPLLTQRGVPLNQWVVYARTEVTGLSLSYETKTESAESYPFQEGEQVCFADINNDGNLGQNEMASCIQSPQGYLCPIQAVQCEATYSDPTCPQGGSLNPHTDRCEYEAQAEVSVNRSLLHKKYVLEHVWGQGNRILFEPQHGGSYYVYLSGFTASGGGFTGSPLSNNLSVRNGGHSICVGRACVTLSGATAELIYGTGWCNGSHKASVYVHGFSNRLEWYAFDMTRTGGFLFHTDCSSGYTYNSTTGLCESLPSCQAGSYDPDQNKCYEGDNTCPYGPQYACMEHDGVSECSPNTCEEFHGSSMEDNDTQEGANDKQDDGSYDANGNCLGTIYIFNGHDRRCRTAGIETGFHNCCSGGSYWFGLAHCKGEEEQLAQMKDDGLCHYVGKYCSNCVQHKKTYCCFSSKLGRILQEQGRPLIASFGPGGAWGDPEGPNCRGFTPEEFQMLDFDRIDLGEWYGDVTTATQSEITGTMQQKINNFYNNIQ